VIGSAVLSSRLLQITVQVATLISGTDITDAALESARELMAAGRQSEG